MSPAGGWGRRRLAAGLRWLGPWRVGGPTAHRLGTVLAVSLVWDVALTVDGRVPAVLLPVAVVATVALYPALTLTCLAALRSPPAGWIARRRPERLLSVAPALLLLLLALVAAQLPGRLRPTAPVQDDETAATVCAAQDVLRGHDPYRTPELACLNRLHASVLIATPLQAGPFARVRTYPTATQLRRAARAARGSGYHTDAFWSFDYPPMAFVWMLPAALGGHAGWVAWTMLAALGWAVFVLRLSGAWWPAVGSILLLQWGDGSVLGAASQGDGEFFAFALTALGLVLLDRPRRSALCLGLALATNPLPWVLLPGYALLAATLPHPRRRLSWLAGTVVAVVLPWLLVYRGAATDILAFLHQLTFSDGAGLTALGVLHLGLPPSRTAMFALFALGSLALLALGALRRPYRAAVPAVAVAAFWLSWRSNANYLAQLPLWAAAVAIGLDRLQRRTPMTDRPSTGASPVPAPPLAAS